MSDELNEETAREVLASPDGYSVEEVVAAMALATPDEVAAAKEVEAKGRNRQGIAKFVHPSLVPPDPEPRISDKLGAGDWEERASWFEAEGVRVTAHAIRGALYGAKPGQLFSQAEVERRLAEFLKREGV